MNWFSHKYFLFWSKNSTTLNNQNFYL